MKSNLPEADFSGDFHSRDASRIGQCLWVPEILARSPVVGGLSPTANQAGMNYTGSLHVNWECMGPFRGEFQVLSSGSAQELLPRISCDGVVRCLLITAGGWAAN